jgi:peptide/nickel transport system permease protein
MPAHRLVGIVLLAAITLVTLAAPVLAPNDPATQFRALVHAPPMPVRFVDTEGRWRGPFFYPLRSVDRLSSTFVEERETPVPLRFWQEGRLLAPAADSAHRWLPLGGDRLGRDVAARLLTGARRSLGVAIAASTGALALGLLAGLVAGYAGGFVDDLLMRLAELVLVLPVLYVVLAARTALPDTLDAFTIALLVTTVLAALGWPVIARGVRAIVAREAALEYAMAARALGASRTRLVVRHLAPATLGFLRTQALQLLPAAILAETTLSFAGLGFPPGEPSWGTLLIEASDIRTFADSPWLLSAALAVVLVVLSVNLVTLGPTSPSSTPGRSAVRTDRPPLG